MARAALIEPLARIGGHSFLRNSTALGAGDNRL